MSEVPERNPYEVGSAVALQIDAQPTEIPKYYVVSTVKFLVLFFGTLGSYALVWMYLHWARYKRATSGPEWPVMRALFPIFFTHSLLEYAEADARRQGHPTPSTGSLATMIVLLTIASSVADRLSSRFEDSIGIPALGLVLMVLQGLSMSKAQKILNAAAGDPRAASNARFTVWNALWLIVFAVLWVFVIVGLLMTLGYIPEE